MERKLTLPKETSRGSRMSPQSVDGSPPVGEAATEPKRAEREAKQNGELVEIGREIRAALECGSAPSMKWLEVHVGLAGIVLSGVVAMPYEGALAELVAKRHARGMPVYSRIQVGVGGRTASRVSD